MDAYRRLAQADYFNAFDIPPGTVVLEWSKHIVLTEEPLRIGTPQQMSEQAKNIPMVEILIPYPDPEKIKPYISGSTPPVFTIPEQPQPIPPPKPPEYVIL